MATLSFLSVGGSSGFSQSPNFPNQEASPGWGTWKSIPEEREARAHLEVPKVQGPQPGTMCHVWTGGS